MAVRRESIRAFILGEQLPIDVATEMKTLSPEDDNVRQVLARFSAASRLILNAEGPLFGQPTQTERDRNNRPTALGASISSSAATR